MVTSERRRSRSGVAGVEVSCRFCFGKQDLTVGLLEPSAGTEVRIGCEPFHQWFPTGGAGLETGRMAITTICPR